MFLVSLDYNNIYMVYLICTVEYIYIFTYIYMCIYMHNKVC